MQRVNMKEQQKESSPDPGTPPEGTEMEPKTLHIFGFQFKLAIAITHLCITLYAMCFFIQIGALPYLTKKLGVDPVVFGYLQTTFAVFQLVGGPVFGRFGDMYGGRAAMTLAFMSATLSYGLTGLAVSVPLLFLSRLPSVFMHAMQGGQMVVTDMSETSKRTDALAKLGLSYGVGMIIGPLLGGWITTLLSEETAALVACAISVVCVVLSLLFVPRQTKKQTSRETGSTSTAVFNPIKLLALVKHPLALQLLMVKLISGIPIGIFQSMFSVIAIEKFDLKADENGQIMSYIGILAMITQGVGVTVLTRRLSDIAILKVSIFIMMWSYLVLAYVQNVLQLCIVLAPLCVGLTLMGVVTGSALTRTVPDTDTGAMLGMNMAVNSAIRTVSPTIGGIMLTRLGFSSFGYLGFISHLVVALFMFVKLK